ncbi:MAG: HU family DNA-binding protein [Alphaproteobacteria bacterium]|nr:HU family DNA-binding protein [Alphaproteobacteria bacterium]
MNKSELVARVSEKVGQSKSVTSDLIESTFSIIESALAKGEEVRIVGFGNFVVTERAESTGRNPRTHEVIKIPASKSPKFRPGKALKDAVNIS